MLDGDEVRQRDGDRLLVRPYIAQAVGGAADREETPTDSPVPADPPEEEPADPTVVLPVVPEQPESLADGRDRRIVLILVGAGLAIIVGAAIGIVALWPGSEGDRSTALPAPPATQPWPVGAGPGAASVASTSASVSASASASASASPSSSRTPSSSASPTRSGPSTPPRTPSAAATLAPPPTADRVGPITGAGGHCLDVRGGVALLGSPASVYDCNGTLSQRWTVAADGTLRVAGSCALADGGAVQIGTCGNAASGQWRAGPGASLVNVGAGQCLSDPDNGAKTGNSLRLAACGGNGQHWTLP